MSKACKEQCSCMKSAMDNNSHIPTAAASGTHVSTYNVSKMDCPSEERIIRMVLGGFDNVLSLSFDLTNRKLEIIHQGENEPITHRLATLGLGVCYL